MSLHYSLISKLLNIGVQISDSINCTLFRYDFPMLGFVKKRKTLFFSVFLPACKPFEFSVKNAIK